MPVSAQRRIEILVALRRGTVPQNSLDAFAVGLERFEPTILDEMAQVKRGGAVFKALRGEYGSGKTFFARWFQEQGRRLGFVTTEVQISETETPLHRLETVYRRLIERLATADTSSGALRAIVDGWFFALEQDLSAEGGDTANTDAFVQRTLELMEKRLAGVTRSAPAFSAVLRAYREATVKNEPAVAEGLLAWLSGQPNVAADVKRRAGIKGDIDHFGALNFLQGLLVVLRDSGFSGLIVVLDEVETLQRVRSDVRDKGLNALRQLMDEIDGGRFPGLYVLVTGTPAFYDGPQGVRRLPPLAQRLQVDFATDARFDNPRAVQIRLPGFDENRLGEVGRRIRDIFADGAASNRLRELANDEYVLTLARAVTGQLGGRVGVAPRLFLKKLVADVLDRVDQFSDFDPRRHYALTIDETELTTQERNARAAKDPDDIEIPV